MMNEAELDSKWKEVEQAVDAAKLEVHLKRFDTSVSDDDFQKLVYRYLDLKKYLAQLTGEKKRIEDNERTIASADDDRMSDAEIQQEMLENQREQAYDDMAAEAFRGGPE